MAREAAIPLSTQEVLKARKPLWSRLLKLARHHPLGTAGIMIIIVLIICALFAEYVAPYDPQGIDPHALRQAPSLSHPFGTDRLGRDVLSRTIFGARISMFIGVVAVIVGTLVGSFFGLVSGYFGKWIDSIIQRAIDMLLAFPALVLLLAILSVIGSSDSAPRKFLAEHTPIPDGTFLGIPVFLQIFVMSLGIGVAIAVGTARVVRGAVLSLKENVYIEAARAMGASDGRIIMKHILPNVMALVAALATIFLPIAILAEAAISFLGLGVPNPVPSWGSDMTGQNQSDAVTRNIWWVVFFPGAALSLTVLAFNMIGDSLRDISDPRLRGGRGGGGGPNTGSGF
ncbi:MAG: ABC transporter permease [Chloroflexota bacterium]